jgi:protein required for attachment to host cells
MTDSTKTSITMVLDRSGSMESCRAATAHQLADVLARGLEQNSYDRLVIVAPPVTLGDLRAAISDRVRTKVVGEVAHDLTKIANNEVAEHLKDLLAT